jgi:hypothetical protein
MPVQHRKQVQEHTLELVLVHNTKLLQHRCNPSCG